MKVLVVGGTGMLGSDIVAELKSRSIEVVAPPTSSLDLTEPESVANVAAMDEVDWCINCAAYTAVDQAEAEEQKAAELNSLGPGYLARACSSVGIKLIHVSTDFVFDGNAHEPYTEESATHPLGAYGRTKLEGEYGVLAALPTAVIFRTSWLFGPNGKCFPKSMISAWKLGKDLRVVADQTGCPTYTADLAMSIVDAMEKDIFPGIYHAAGPDAMTWYDLARLSIEAYRDFVGLDRPVEIERINSEDWPTPAQRPKYSVLSTAKLEAAGIPQMRPIRAALADFVRRLAD